jgi:hypothetical protein
MDIKPFILNYMSFFPFVFIFLWLLSSIVISRIGGWASLARLYRMENSFDGERWRFRSGQMRYFMSYNNCLTIGADRRGLYLSVFFLLRAGHPALLIPWSDIITSDKKYFFMTIKEFQFPRLPGVYLRISSKVAGNVLAKREAAEVPINARQQSNYK